jgi:hypothetical protein
VSSGWEAGEHGVAFVCEIFGRRGDGNLAMGADFVDQALAGCAEDILDVQSHFRSKFAAEVDGYAVANDSEAWFGSRLVELR